MTNRGKGGQYTILNWTSRTGDGFDTNKTQKIKRTENSEKGSLQQKYCRNIVMVKN